MELLGANVPLRAPVCTSNDEHRIPFGCVFDGLVESIRRVWVYLVGVCLGASLGLYLCSELLAYTWGVVPGYSNANRADSPSWCHDRGGHKETREFTPSTFTQMAPVPSLEASQQTHIDDLVQRNRSLEHAAKLLRDDLDREKARSKHALSDVHKRWKADQKEWHEGVDVLLSCHRIVLWRKTIDLQTERLNFLKEEEDIRLGKISRLQRDYRITQFQQSESQYVSRQELLNAEIDALNRKQITQKDKWKAHSAALLSRVQDRETRLEAATKEVDRLSVWYPTFFYTLSKYSFTHRRN